MKNRKREDVRYLGRALLVISALMLIVAMMQAPFAAHAEEGVAISSRSESVEALPAGTVTASKNMLGLGIGITPLYGIIQSVDGNKLLQNKYTAGLTAEIQIFNRLSVEGVFRYAEYDVRPDLVFRDGNMARVSAAFGGGTESLNRFGYGIIGDMRQIMLGGNLKYELFPHSILTPYIGGGVVHFSNDYYTSSDENFVKVTLPQSVYAANAIGGVKLKLSDQFSLLCRGEAGTLLNNKNGSIFYYRGRGGEDASIYAYQNFRSYDKYVSGMVGLSLGL